MNRHTDQLYRLAELPAFIEEALSNVSLKGIIAAYQEYRAIDCCIEIEDAVSLYAEKWVDDWMARNPESAWADVKDFVDHEIIAINTGVEMFSNPDCKAGLPE